MRKTLLAVLFALVVSVSAFAQTDLYPNTYHIGGASGSIPALPAASTKPKKIVNVDNGTDGTDCTVGGGTANHACRSDGSVWSAWGDGNVIGSGVVVSVSGTPPINSTGGTSPTISIDNAKADGSTKGAADFLAADFNDDGAGKISIDYANGQKATDSIPGLLSAVDHTTFNAKVPPTRTVNGHALSSDVTVTPTDLSLVIGTNVEAWNAKLDSIAALANAAGWLHNNGSGTFAYSTPTASDVGAEVPLTFSTGLTRTVNTVTVNTSQNIAKLSNLTTNGFVKTGSSDGTLSVDTTIYVPQTRTITVSGLGLSGGGDLSVDRTITIASSSNPGAGASLLASDSAGKLQIKSLGVNMSPVTELDVSGEFRVSNTSYFNGNILARGTISKDTAAYLQIDGGSLGRTYFPGSVGIGTSAPGQPLEVAGNVFVNASTANLFLKNTSTGWQSSSSTIINPQANNSIRSTSFLSGLVGWSINAQGNAEFDNVDVRGAIHAGVFVYNALVVTAGTQLVTPSAAKLKNDVNVPASPTYGTTTVTIDVEDQDGLTHAFSQLFSVNDILQIKDAIAAGGSTWFKVTAVSDQTTFWRYTASIQAGSANSVYRAGLGVPDYKQSGAGFIVQTADQTNAPYLQMATHDGTFTTAGSGGTLNVTPQLRLGNLNGSYGYGSDIYGFGTGQYGSAAKTWLTIDQSNGIRLGNNTTTLAQWATTGDIFLGITGGGQSNILLSASGAITLRNNSTVRILLQNDGSGFLANSAISWDTSGNLTMTGNAVIGGVTIGNGKMFIGTGTYNNTNTSFYVDSTGQFSLKDKLSWDGTTLSISGALTSISGTIGGFSLGSDYLRDAANSFGLASTVTGGDDVRFWAGDTFANRATAPFNVTEAGVVTMTSGAIAGKLLMSGASSAIAIGPTPPTSASAGTGVWLDRTGLYSLNANVQGLVVNSTGLSIVADSLGYTDAAAIKFVDGSNQLTRIYTYGTAATTSQTGIVTRNDNGASFLTLSTENATGAAANPGAAQLLLTYNPTTGLGRVTMGVTNGEIRLSNATVIGGTTPNAMLDVRGDAIITGLLKAGSGPTTLTDSAGKILAASLNTVTTAVGGTNKTSWTAGSIPYLASSSAFEQDNSHFFWDATNHRLGIGTTNPASPIDVAGATFPNPQIRLSSAGVAQGWFDTGGSVRNWIVALNWNVANVLEFTPSTANGGSTFSTPVMQLTGGGGVQVGSPTGGDKGVGAINAVTVWRNGTSLDSVFEPEYKLLSIDQMGEFLKTYNHLPTIPTDEVNKNGSTNLGALEDRLWETTEVHALYILQLNDRIKVLEALVADLERRKN